MSDSYTIKIKKQDLWKYSTIILVVVLLLIIILGGSGQKAGTVSPEKQIPKTGNVVVEIEDNDPILGDRDAKISIVEFSDFQCPFCGRAHTGALADFRNSDYFKNGEVNLVYKQFPLSSIHPYAQKAGEASLCAQDQGKFWEYHDILFANSGALDTPSLKSYAIQLGLNTNTFDSCLDGDDYKQEVLKEISQATDAGGRGTPYFVVINTKTGETQVVSGAVPWTNFEQAISLVQ